MIKLHRPTDILCIVHLYAGMSGPAAAARDVFVWLVSCLIPPTFFLTTPSTRRSWCKAQCQSRCPPRERRALPPSCWGTACSTGWARSWAWTRCEAGSGCTPLASQDHGCRTEHFLALRRAPVPPPFRCHNCVAACPAPPHPAAPHFTLPRPAPPCPASGHAPERAAGGRGSGAAWRRPSCRRPQAAAAAHA